MLRIDMCLGEVAVCSSLACCVFCFCSSSISFIFFSAILNLALRERGFCFTSSLPATITLLFISLNGVCTFPKKILFHFSFHIAGLHDIFHHSVFQRMIGNNH